MTALKTLDTSIRLHQYELANGNYSPMDAREIVNRLIDTKINFLKLKNLSQQVRFDCPDDEALRAIEGLMESKESIQQLIQEARISERRVVVISSITISLE